MTEAAGLAIRDATPDDLGTIARLVRALAEYERLLHEARGTEEDFRRALFGDPPRAHALIVEVGGAPAGFAVWYFAFSTFLAKSSLYVEDVFVEPAHRGRGLGRAVFRDLARRALAAGCGRMEWSVLDWNAPSIAFYRALGAVPREGWMLQRLTGPALSALAGEG